MVIRRTLVASLCAWIWLIVLPAWAAEGKSRQAVVIEGSKDQLAPVLMTAAAAALGVLPLVLGDPAGKELERPMAHVILGGLFTSTVLNMIVVPVVFAKFGWEREKVFARQQETQEALFLGHLFRSARRNDRQAGHHATTAIRG